MADDTKQLAEALRLELRWAQRFARESSRELNLAIRDAAYFVEHTKIDATGTNPNRPQQLGILAALRGRLVMARALNAERQAILKTAETAYRDAQH